MSNLKLAKDALDAALKLIDETEVALADNDSGASDYDILATKLSKIDISPLTRLTPAELQQIHETVSEVQSRIGALEQSIQNAREDTVQEKGKTTKASFVANGYANMNNKGKK